MAKTLEELQKSFPWLVWSVEDIIFLENVKKGFCLIAAFTQFLHSEEIAEEIGGTERITDTNLYKNIECFMQQAAEFMNQDLLNLVDTGLSEISIETIQKWKEDDLYTEIQSRGTAITGYACNFEILEYFILKMNLDIKLYYLKQVSEYSSSYNY
jgi:hypothetical protein